MHAHCKCVMGNYGEALHDPTHIHIYVYISSALGRCMTRWVCSRLPYSDVIMCHTTHVSVITQEGDSTLMRAARGGKTEVVVELVKAGANVDMQNGVRQYILYGMCTCVYAYTVIVYVMVLLAQPYIYTVLYFSLIS